MKSKYVGMGLIAMLFVAVGWFIAQPPLAQQASARAATR